MFRLIFPSLYRPRALAFRRSSNPKRSQAKGRPESVGKKFAARG
jgi:hypothetical protein